MGSYAGNVFGLSKKWDDEIVPVFGVPAADAPELLPLRMDDLRRQGRQGYLMRK